MYNFKLTLSNSSVLIFWFSVGGGWGGNVDPHFITVARIPTIVKSLILFYKSQTAHNQGQGHDQFNIY